MEATAVPEQTSPHPTPRRAYVLAFLAYAAFWIATRLPAIRANALFFDDFAMGPVSPADFYIGSYRPVLFLEHVVLEFVRANHFWTVLPKIAAALYLAGAGTALARLLWKWGVPAVVAFATPLIALANPVLNDAGLWQLMHGVCLSLLLITAGAVVWDWPTPVRRAWGALLILAGVLGYQIFISLAVFYAVAEPVVKAVCGIRWRVRDAIEKLAIIGGIAVVQILEMQLTRAFRPAHDSRGFVHVTSVGAFVSEKVHGLVNLAVNGVMPVLAWYFGALRAMSLWKFVPASLVVATVCAIWMRSDRTRRGAALAAAAAGLPFAALLIPGLPGIIMSISPYAWRVSSPVAFALAVACVPALASIRSNAVRLTLVAIAVATMVPVSFDESRMRVTAADRETRLLDEVSVFWRSRGLSPSETTILYAGAGQEDPRLRGSRQLTWGYEIRTPRMWSSFTSPWFAKYRVEQAGFRFAECPGGGSACARADSLCARNCSDVAAVHPRIAHDVPLRATYVCTTVIPGSPPGRCE